MAFKVFGKRVYLDLDLVARQTRIPCRGGATFDSKKTPKLEKIEMVSKIYGKKVIVHRNNLKVQDSPQGLYKYLIQLILWTIMNNQKPDISNDYMRLVIHWV